MICKKKLYLNKNILLQEIVTSNKYLLELLMLINIILKDLFSFLFIYFSLHLIVSLNSLIISHCEKDLRISDTTKLKFYQFYGGKLI